MLVLGVRCFLLLLLWARLRSLAQFVKSINSFGSEAHSIEVVCCGYVSHAFVSSILAAVALRSRVSNFLTRSLWGHTLDGIGHFIPFPHLLESYIYWEGSQTIYQFIWGLSRLDLHIFQLVYLASLRHSMVHLRC